MENDSGMHSNLLQQLASSEATTRGKKTWRSVQEAYQRQGASQSNIPAFKFSRCNQASSIEPKPIGSSRTSSAPDSSILLGESTAPFLQTVHDIKRNERSNHNGTSHPGNHGRRGVIMGQGAGTGLRAAPLTNI